MKSSTIGWVGVLVLFAAAMTAYAQVRPMTPGHPDLIQTHQLEMLRAENLKLHVELTTCHDENMELRNQLKAYNQDESGDEAKLESCLQHLKECQKKQSDKTVEKSGDQAPAQ